MAFDKQGTGLVVLRLMIGTFFLFEGLGKLRWFTDTSILSGVFKNWSESAAAGSVTAWYLSHVAVPGLPIFARLVPLGEILGGVALLVGLWTPLVALLAFIMVLNIHVASGAIFKYSFLSNGYGLPVLGSTLALAIGGVRLRWSVR
jgi:uncharacterized membrane protein YphA (DoxX/SURF4 family)